MAKYAKRSIYLAPEASYAQSPRPADSAYVAIPASGTLTASGGPATLRANRFTGRTGVTAGVAGQTNAEASFGLELLGLATQGGDGDSPSPQDHLDLIFRGVSNGTPVEIVGESVTDLTGAPMQPLTDLTLATDLYSAGDLIALVDADGNIAWAAIATDNADGTYVLDYEPQVDGAAIVPTLALPIRQWVDDDGEDRSITYAGMYLLDPSESIEREIPGLRVSSLNCEFAPSQLATMNVGLQGDDFAPPAVSPSFSVGVNGDPAVVAGAEKITGCVYVDGVLYGTASVTLDLGLGVADRPTTCRRSGRASRLLVTANPTVTITTPFRDAWQTLQASKTTVDIKVVSGLDSGSLCFWAPHCEIEAPPTEVDTNGILDQSVAFTVITVGAGRRWVVGRV